MPKRAEPNRFLGVNYLDIDHRMAVPPEYWLQRLYDYDDHLVVFPSIRTPYAYVLARRRQYTAGLNTQALESAIDQPDTKFCLRHGLMPVSMIYRFGDGWSIDNIIRSLQARDIWRQGGAEAMADKIEAGEADAEKQRKAALRNEFDARAALGYAIYKRRTGQRVSSSGLGSERQSPTAGSSGSTASAGSVTLT